LADLAYHIMQPKHDC